MDRTLSDFLALRELPGDEGDARPVERIPNRRRCSAATTAS